MTSTPRPDLELAAERCARAMLTGYTGTPRSDPMDLLAADLTDVAKTDQGLFLALVAAAATAAHAGTLTALRVHGVDVDAILADVALTREQDTGGGPR